MCLKQSCVDVSSVSTVNCGNCSMRGVSRLVIIYRITFTYLIYLRLMSNDFFVLFVTVYCLACGILVFLISGFYFFFSNN